MHPTASAQQRVAETGDLFLRQFVNVWLGLAVAIWVFEVFFTPGVQYPGLVLMTAGVATKWAILKHRMLLARCLLVGLMTVYAVITPALVSGVRTPVVIVMVPLLLLAGWLLGRKVAAVLSILFAAVVVFYWQAEAQQWISFNTPLRAPPVWVMTWTSAFVVMGFTIWFFIKNYESNFEQQSQLQEQLQAALAEARGLHIAMDTVPSYVFVKDTAGRYLYANKPVCDLFGRSLKDIQGATDEEFFSLSEAADLRINDRRALDNGERIEAEERNYIAATGETRHYWTVKSPIRNEDGTIIGLCGISTDITESKRAQEALQRAHAETQAANQALAISAQFNETILLNSPAPMAVYKASGPCVAVNDAYAHVAGTSRDALLAQNFLEVPSFKVSGLREACLKALADNKAQQLELQFMTSFGKQVFAECRILPVQLHDGAHLLLQAVDLTERKHYEEELQQLAFHDALTRLPNRRLLLDRLKHALHVSQRANSHGAVLFLDLNKFKQLNDTHGHEAGDLLLVEVAHRLKRMTRETDTVARLGGDEFVVLLEGLGADAAQAAAHAAQMAEKIRQTLTQPYVLGDIHHHGSASTGIRLFLGDRDDADALLKDADAAMYAEKQGRTPQGPSMMP